MVKVTWFQPRKCLVGVILIMYGTSFNGHLLQKIPLFPAGITETVEHQRYNRKQGK
jgi:hypothetical protein